MSDNNTAIARQYVDQSHPFTKPHPSPPPPMPSRFYAIYIATMFLDLSMFLLKIHLWNIFDTLISLLSLLMIFVLQFDKQPSVLGNFINASRF